MNLSPDKFDAFDIHDTTYTSSTYSIPVSVLVPKNITPGRHPLAIRYHGGALIGGTRLFLGFAHPWLLSFIASHGAILVMPDHRLLPESKGTEILEDVDAFVTWVNSPSGLGKELESISSRSGVDIQADLQNALVVGESAGGYLAVQTALLHAPQRLNVKAVISQYGMLHVRDRYFNEAFEKIILDTPMMPQDTVQKHIEGITPGSVVFSATPPQRYQMTTAAIQWGEWGRLAGVTEEKGNVVVPEENLAKKQKGEVPPMWLLHGSGDTAVPASGSEWWVERVKEFRPEADVKLTIEPGEHGFDGQVGIGSETGWVKEGVEWVQKYWP